jgi:hypothetical protein
MVRNMNNTLSLGMIEARPLTARLRRKPSATSRILQGLLPTGVYSAEA